MFFWAQSLGAPSFDGKREQSAELNHFISHRMTSSAAYVDSGLSSASMNSSSSSVWLSFERSSNEKKMQIISRASSASVDIGYVDSPFILLLRSFLISPHARALTTLARFAYHPRTHSMYTKKKEPEENENFHSDAAQHQQQQLSHRRKSSNEFNCLVSWLRLGSHFMHYQRRRRRLTRAPAAAAAIQRVMAESV